MYVKCLVDSDADGSWTPDTDPFGVSGTLAIPQSVNVADNAPVAVNFGDSDKWSWSYISCPYVAGMSKFPATSYFPIVENMTWTDNLDRVTKMTNVNSVWGSFKVVNDDVNTKYMDGMVGMDDTGWFVAPFGQVIDSNFLLITWAIGGHKAFLYAEENLSLAKTWSNTIRANNGIEVAIVGKVLLLSDSITPVAGTTYDECLKIEFTFTPQSDYGDGYATKQTFWYKKGIGCVQTVLNWSDGETKTWYVKSYTTP